MISLFLAPAYPFVDNFSFDRLRDSLQSLARQLVNISFAVTGAVLQLDVEGPDRACGTLCSDHKQTWHSPCSAALAFS